MPNKIRRRVFSASHARRSPAVRYAVACGALATMLALPVATTWSMTWRGARRSEDAARPSAAVPDGIRMPTTSVSAGIAGGLLTESVRSRVEALRPWALVAWFAGVLLLSVRFLGGLRTANRLTRRETRPASEEWQQMLERLATRLAVTRPVRLLQSAVVKVPTAIGAFRPAILLPASVFTGLPARGLEALIAHELAHVRRHDYLVNLVQTAAETLLFYHPAVWWVSSRIARSASSAATTSRSPRPETLAPTPAPSSASRRCGAPLPRSPLPRGAETSGDASSGSSPSRPPPRPLRAGSRERSCWRWSS
jgi:beta-lactamase regulating signal transducer with metallopeptidase domain